MAVRRHNAVAADVKSDIKAARKIRLPWWGVLSGIIGSFLAAWLLDPFGRLELALPTLNSLAVLGFAIAIKRNLARRPWFWITIAVIAGLHVLLILSVPWTTKWVPAAAIVPFAVAGLYAILAIVSFDGNLIERRV